MTETFHRIETEKDIAFFLDSTNNMHDGYLIGVQYIHNGHTGANPHRIDSNLTELRIRYLVTSIQNAIVELVFSSLVEWQIRDNSFDITDTMVAFSENRNIVWADDCLSASDVRESNSYVIAQKMQWRFVNS